MTDVVRLTIDLGGNIPSWHQQIHGQVIAEENDHIVFKDAESEEPHKIFKRNITNISHDVITTDTTLVT